MPLRHMFFNMGKIGTPFWESFPWSQGDCSSMCPLEDRFTVQLNALITSFTLIVGLQENQNTTAIKGVHIVIFGLLPLPPCIITHKVPEINILVCTHMHSVNHKWTNEHLRTNIGMHSPPNIYTRTWILLFFLLSSLYILIISFVPRYVNTGTW